MKNWKLRLAALALSVSMALSTGAPVMAAEISVDAGGNEKSGFVENLLEVPVIGEFLRLFVGDEPMQTGETATAETATGETATGETATPTPSPTPSPSPSAEPSPTPTAAPTETAAPSETQTPQPTAAPSETPDPAGEPTPTAAPTATPAPAAAVLTETQWGAVTLYSGTLLRASSREETNFGDLVTDAMVYAVRKSDRYSQDLASLPLVAVVNGGRFQGTLDVGTPLNRDSLQNVLTDGDLSLVTVTPAKLREILNAGLVGMLDSGSERFGNFLQVSGLRFVYQTSNNETTVKQAWLTDPDGGNARELNLSDTSSRIALVFPTDLLEFYGLAAGYTDALSGAGLSLYGVLESLPANCDADVLAALLARGGCQGRILPVSAGNYSAMLLSDLANANRVVRCLVDGKEVQGYTDSNGSLILDNLSAGSHTIRLKAGEPAYYISNITYVGTATGMVVMLSIPQDCLGASTASATATPGKDAGNAASATATPSPEQGDTHPDIGPAIAAGTWGQDDSAAPSAAPESPAVTPAPTKAPAKGSGTVSTATPNPIQDPTSGTILGATPVPTLEPTPSPSPTPEPTPDPEEVAKQQNLEKASSRIPLYVGCGLVIVCVLVVAALFIKRRMEETKHETYRKRK